MNKVYITTKWDLRQWVSDQWKPCSPESYSFDSEEMIDAITDYLWMDLLNNGNWKISKPLPDDIDVFDIADKIERGYQEATNCDREGFCE